MDCVKKVHSKGMCQAHYRLFKKYGVPQVLSKEDRRRPGPVAKARSEKISAPKVPSTHCRAGHEYTEESTYYWGTTRHCRVCSKETMRERRKNDLRVGRGVNNSFKTYCPSGHPYDENNTITRINKKTNGVHRACRECARLNMTRQNVKRYNITVEQFNEMISSQNEKCAICKGKFWEEVSSPHIDHDHSCCPKQMSSCGKCVRGLLCRSCNQILGCSKDNLDTLRFAIAYLSASI